MTTNIKNIAGALVGIALAGGASAMEYVPYIQEHNEDVFDSMVRGLGMRKRIESPLIKFSTDADKAVNVPTCAIVDGVVYATYFANRLYPREWPHDQTAVFAYARLDDPENVTTIDLFNIGDIFDGKEITQINDVILFKKSDKELILNAAVYYGGTWHNLYAVYDIAAKKLGEFRTRTLTIDGDPAAFDNASIKKILDAKGIKYRKMYGNISFTPKITTRVEYGVPRYYTGIFNGGFNAIVKSVDMIDWEFVATPDFMADYSYDWENTVYVSGDHAYCCIRQTGDRRHAVLAKYDLAAGKWTEHAFLNACCSRGDFIEWGGRLYLVCNGRDRGSLRFMEINKNCLAGSRTVLDVAFSGATKLCFPMTCEYGSRLYMIWNDSWKAIRFAEITPEFTSTDDIAERLSGLLKP